MRNFTKSRTRATCILCAFAFGTLVFSSGCFLLQYGLLLRGDCFSQLLIRGRLLDAATQSSLTNAAVGASISAEGELVSWVNPLTQSGIPSIPPPSEDGSFELQLSAGPLGPCPPPDFPTVDTIEIVVLSGGCEQTFVIDVPGETTVDASGGIDVLEITNPIVVPRCP